MAALTVGEAIRRIRKRRKENTTELAERIGVTAASISRYENGQVPPSKAVLKHLLELAETEEEQKPLQDAIEGEVLLRPDVSQSIVKEIRIASGETRAGFARKLGIDVPYLRELEYGEKAPVPTLAHRLHKVAITVERPDLALAVTEGRWGVRHVLRPGETLITSRQETESKVADPRSELHAMVDQICNGGYDEAVRLARSGLVLALESIRLLKPGHKKQS